MITSKGLILAIFVVIGYFSMLYPPLYHLWIDVKKARGSKGK